MNSKIKLFLLLIAIICAVALVTSCSGDGSPYGDYNEEGYTVSVKYDANGGAFTTNTSVVVDTYDPSTLKTNDNGELIVPIIDPSDPVRGSANAFSATRGGYFLAGWYSERIPVTDANGNHLDVDGGIASKTGKDKAYTYSGRVDFKNSTVTIAKDAEYSADVPAITLYAAWVKEFSFEFYHDGQLIGTYKYNPLYTTEIKMPAWNEKTGKLDTYQFPKVTNMTFNKAYYDADMTSEVLTDTVKSGSTLDLESATAINTTTKIYLDMIDGEWFRITSADQLISNAKVSGCYEILADLDFTGKIWPSAFAFKAFGGQFIGNGHKISGIEVEQSSTSDQYAGIFGQISSTAKISNVEFENVTVTIKKGTLRVARYGLFAGTISKEATLQNITITNSALYISSKIALSSDFEVGLIAGLGYEFTGNMDYSGITCEAINESNSLYDLVITLDGNYVEIEQKEKEE